MATKLVMRCLGSASIVTVEYDQEVTGKYLKEYDPDGNNGFGRIVFTEEPTEAKSFESSTELFETWGAQSTVRPLRPDGMPNRPLTAYHMEFVQIEVPDVE